ncbi:MAG: hypothetical protein M1834_003687 [Cirrosporium novae-zelandiae]|nr:MAG: hypothetical protein M1834_003687 [Cirrosporium novae-zelandiae]
MGSKYEEKLEKGDFVGVGLLWEEGRKIFYETLSKDISTTLRDETTLSDTIEDLRYAQEKASKEYGTHTVQAGNSTISFQLDRIMKRLDLMLEIGDDTMDCAPDTVSLAWSAFRMIFKVFLCDSETCSFLTGAVDKITDVMFVCEAYARRYLKGKSKIEASTIAGNKVLMQIPSVYADILKFSYQTRKLLSHSKIGRSFTSYFGGKRKELEDTIDDIKDKREKLRETAGIDFENSALEILESLHQDSKVLSDLFETITDVVPVIKSLQADQAESKEQQERNALNRRFQDQLQWLQSGTSVEADGPERQCNANLRKRQHGTCKWILRRTEFQVWQEGNPSLLWLVGEAGVGKSILVSSVIKTLSRFIQGQSDRKSILVHFYCKTGNNATQQGPKIMLHLLSQLFTNADTEEERSTISTTETKLKKEKCINIVKNARERLDVDERKDPSLAQIKYVLQPMFVDLVRILETRVFVVVDGMDECLDQRIGLLDALRELPTAGPDIRVLISSRPENDIHRLLSRTPTISVTKVQTDDDVHLYLNKSLKAIKDFDPEQRKKAIKKIMTRANGMFRYVDIVVQNSNQLRTRQRTYKGLISHLPDGMNSLYRQTLQNLRKDDRDMLLVALRWLMCGEGKIDALWVADELDNLYKDSESDESDESDKDDDDEDEDKKTDDKKDEDDEDGSDETEDDTDDSSLASDPTTDPYYSNHDISATRDGPGGTPGTANGEEELDTIKDLRHIGRDFLKFDSNIILLQHDSIRDLIKEDQEIIGKEASRCDKCRERFNPTLQAGPRYGHLDMLRIIFQHLNSESFQKQYILIDGLYEDPVAISETPADQSPVNDKNIDQDWTNIDNDSQLGNQDRRKNTKESEGTNLDIESNWEDSPGTDNSAPGPWNQKFPGETLRYELTHWPYHLQAAEQAWPEKERDAATWNMIYEAAETFMSPDSPAFKCWMIRVLHWRRFEKFDHPFHIASRYGLVGLMQRYLDRGVDVNILNEDGNTPLHLASDGEGNYVGLDVLINHKADINIKNEFYQETPLLIAVDWNAPHEVIRLLLRSGSNPETPDCDGQTCLHYAVRSGNLAVCKMLLRHSVNVNARDKDGKTALHKIFEWPNAQVDMVRLLLDNRADPNVQDKDSQAPLYRACLVGNVEGAQMLLKYGADIDDGENIFGRTALHGAIVAKSLGLVKMLIEKRANLSIRDKQERDPIAEAVHDGNNEILSYLLKICKEKGFDMRFLLTSDIGGYTPLHRCAASGNLDAMEMLLGAGDSQAMCSQKNLNGATPLHSAAQAGHAKAVNILLEHGSDPSVKSNDGKTAFDLTFATWKMGCDDPDTVIDDTDAAFEETICTLAVKDLTISHQPDLLQFAIEKGCMKVCKLLAESKLVNEEDCHGWTPLALAFQCEDHNIINLLAKPDQKPLLDTSGTKKEITLGHSPTRWSSTDKHAELTVSADGLEVCWMEEDDIQFDPKAIRADHPIPSGRIRFYYEITVVESDVESPAVALGFCSQYALLDQMPGWLTARALTWGYHAHDGKKYMYGDIGGFQYQEQYGPGDVVGCGVDFDKNIIYYTKNGIRLPTAFDNVRGRLFPVIGIGEFAKIRTNFGLEKDKPFEYAAWEHDEGIIQEVNP